MKYRRREIANEEIYSDEIILGQWHFEIENRASVDIVDKPVNARTTKFLPGGGESTRLFLLLELFRRRQRLFRSVRRFSSSRRGNTKNDDRRACTANQEPFDETSAPARPKWENLCAFVERAAVDK